MIASFIIHYPGGKLKDVGRLSEMATVRSGYKFLERDFRPLLNSGFSRERILPVSQSALVAGLRKTAAGQSKPKLGGCLLTEGAIGIRST